MENNKGGEKVKVKKLIFICTLLLILIGCNNQETITEDLPENLIIEIDQTSDTVSSAPILTVEFIQIDEDKAIETFFNDEVAEEESNAYGRAFFADQTEEPFEILYVYGDKDTALMGGLRYAIYDDSRTDYYQVVSVDPGPPSYVVQEVQTFNDNYSSFTDLLFKPYQQVIDEIINKLNLVDLKEVELEVIYALDQETMNDHLMKIEANNKYSQEEESDNIAFSKDDEAYLLQLRQFLNGIPVVNFLWQSHPIDINNSSHTQIRAIYNKNGIHELDVQEFYTIIAEGDEQRLLNQTEALSEVIKRYQNKIISSVVVIDQAELNYIGIIEGSERKLVPAWIFRTATEIEETGEDINYQDYQFIVIDAITGEEIKL